jgi:DNA (cytosine-5)-methyltransferase 1
MLTYLAIADRLRPKWIVWENVPGVLSSNGGRDFGTFLGSLGQLGYGWAYRVLDAQYLRVGRWPRAVPQRRRRVFVVGCLGDWAAAGEVLALAEGLQRNLEAGGKARKGVAADAEGRVARCITTGEMKRQDYETCTMIAQPTAYRWQNDRDGLQQDDAVAALRASQGASGFHEMNHPVIAQPVPFTKSKLAQSTSDDETWVDGQVNPTLSLFDQGDTRATTVAVAHAFYSTGGTHGVNQHPEVSPAVKVGSGLGIPSPPAVAKSMTVRRLTPSECERLQGFPDDWTMIPYRGKSPEDCPDGPRYKALGNSMACNCMAWIGERIAAYEEQNGST